MKFFYYGNEDDDDAGDDDDDDAGDSRSMACGFQISDFVKKWVKESREEKKRTIL